MILKRLFLSAAIGMSMLTGLSTAVMSHDDLDNPKDNNVLLRKQVENISVQWRAAGASKVKVPRNIKLLGFNDFHGQLSTGKLVGGRPVGGAAVLASYLHAAQAQAQDGSIIVHAGDFVGASPAASALLQDEPSITFLNMLANDACAHGKMNREGNGNGGGSQNDQVTALVARLATSLQAVATQDDNHGHGHAHAHRGHEAHSRH